MTETALSISQAVVGPQRGLIVGRVEGEPVIAVSPVQRVTHEAIRRRPSAVLPVGAAAGGFGGRIDATAIERSHGRQWGTP